MSETFRDALLSRIKKITSSDRLISALVMITLIKN